ncbi:nicotinate-nucleotide--dimethylbenzimidazole phosphoribosyltransferase [Streptomyces sp. NPDC048196]|uniref:nicotinate-nucleotide--dimethylbenzimidazole phosphoribosyltransferase n=1 Tax=Streptomyces sp. NPDC048196 TaxID=3154712 RepID=UPI0033F9DFBC
MTDTGQVPGEGQPENAGGHPGQPQPAAAPSPADAGPTELPGMVTPQGDYPYLDQTDPAVEDDDLLLMPGAQGAWSEQPAGQPLPHETLQGPAQQPQQGVPFDAAAQGATGYEAMPAQAGDHESGGRDSGSVDLSAVRIPQPAAPQQPDRARAAAPNRRPLHMGPPVPDATGGVVRSLADRGPADAPAPARHAAPPAGAPEYFDAAAAPAQAPVAPEAAAAAQQVPAAPQDAQPAPAQAYAAPQPQAGAAPYAEQTYGGQSYGGQSYGGQLSPEQTYGAAGQGPLPGPQLGEIPAQMPAWNDAAAQAAPAPAPEPAPAAEPAAVAAPAPVADQLPPVEETATAAEAAPVADAAPAAEEAAAPAEALAAPAVETAQPVAQPVTQDPELPAEQPQAAEQPPVAQPQAQPEPVAQPAEGTADGTAPGEPAEAPTEEQPTAQAPEAQIPDAQIPDTQAQEAPVQDAPAQEVPAQEVSAQEVPVQDVPEQGAAEGTEDEDNVTVDAAAQPQPEAAAPEAAASEAVASEAVASEAAAAPQGPVALPGTEDGAPVEQAVAPVEQEQTVIEPPEATTPDPSAAAAVTAAPEGEATPAAESAAPAADATPDATPDTPADASPEAAVTPEAAATPEAAPAPEPAATTPETSAAPVTTEQAATAEAAEPDVTEEAAAVAAEEAREPAQAADTAPAPELPQAADEQPATPADAPAARPGTVHIPAQQVAEQPAGEQPSDAEQQPQAAADDTLPQAQDPAGTPAAGEAPEEAPADEAPHQQDAEALLQRGEGADEDQPQEPAAVPAADQPQAVDQPAADEQPAAEESDAADGAPEAEEVPAGPPAAGYDDSERAAVHRVMRERRDIRNGFRSDPIPNEVLLRVLEAAHTAPSVGHSQPWDFVVIRSAETREKMHQLAMQQRDAYAKSLPKARAKQFRELKIEAILETPVNIVVTADPTRGGRHTLGRHTQPQMAPYSSALAVENLWLAARAEGLGVGWVSFFDEREMVRELGLPEHLEVVAYLCVGYVDEFPEEPELLQAGWSKRRPLSWVVHEETYGRRALPGENPHDLLQETLQGIRPLDAKALGEAWERQKRMTKPAGALGMLEIISAQLSGLSRKCPPPIPEPAAVAIFAGDHGVHAQGVTPWPQEVTGQMVANFLGGGAVCNAFANQVGAEVCVVDVGVAGELPATPGLLPRKVRPGTADFTQGPALTQEEVLKAVEVGIETARDLVAAGNKALLTGEMGIANTTTSAALIAVYTGVDPAEVTGRGTGINDETHARKVDVVRRALELHQPDPADPIGVLAAVGGLEHAALVGLILGGASLRTPVILDGVSAGAAALVARAIAPEALAACIAGHRSAEPGHVAALNKLGLRPLVDLDLRLGEGTGALLALPVVQSAARAMHEVATFDSAGVTEKS